MLQYARETVNGNRQDAGDSTAEFEVEIDSERGVWDYSVIKVRG